MIAFIFGSCLVISSFFSVALRISNINRIIFLAGAFLFSGILAVLQGCSFLGSMIIIVYMGAVIILLLFLVMMIKYENKIKSIGRLKIFVCGLSAFLISATLYSFLIFSIPHKGVILNLDNYTDYTIYDIARFLYSHKNFELVGLVSFILLISMVGAVIVGAKKYKH